MSYQVPSITKEFRSQVCMMFEDATDPADTGGTGFTEEDPSLSSNDYAALCWLVREQHLTQAQVAKIVEGMTREAIESLFWLEEATYKFTQHIGNPVTFCRIDLAALVVSCQQRLQIWQLLPPFVWSPYQRPYFFGQTETQKKLLPELQLQQKFSTVLKGLSFRHLGVLMNKDELKVAGALIPYISEEIVVLRDPQPPFDLLPKIPSSVPKAFQKFAKQAAASPVSITSKPDDTDLEVSSEQSTYTIACIDDSPTVLTEIGRLLDESNFKVLAIADPLKALVQILKAKPDLILLDVTMPKINGYELCRLIRNNPAFKHTPIIMVTGNTGLIDRAKAKVSGATDYLTKPFTQEGLLKIIFRHLA